MALAPARQAFMPPPTPGMGRAVLLALLAHAALVLALSFAVQWHQSAPETVTFAAELWAKVPTQAAPPAAPEPMPEPYPEEPPPVVEPLTPPKPAPTPAPVAPEPPAPPKAADIALEKKKAQQEAKKMQELAQAKAQAALQLEKDKADKLKKQKAEAEKQQTDKAKATKLKEEKLATEKRLKEEKAAEAARKKEEQQAAEDAAQSEQRRKEAKDRALRLAGAAVGNGEPDAKGNAAQSAGPSATYGAKVAAAIRTNISQVKEIPGNPTVEYDVTTDPGGNVLSAKLRKTSGNPYWDETAYNAILKTAKLPRDENGRVPSPMTIVLEPKPH
ncbi:MAG: cell envelope integrity protein TolA [Betaproteobacteria bacterium]